MGAGQVMGQTDRLQMRGDPFRILRAAQAKARRIAEGERHAGGHALAMEQRVGKAGIGLQRMAEGVAQVQQGAPAGRLALVIGDDRRLSAHAALDRIGAGCRVAVQQPVGIGLAPGEEVGIVDQAIFDHLGIAGAGFAQRQAVEHRRVDQHQAGLVEAADQILAGARVDRGLAADRAVDLRQQGGGQLHEMAAALQDGRRKADQVADHAAAQRDYMVATLDLQRQQRVEQFLQMAPALGLFARRQDDRFDDDIGAAQAGVEPGQLRRRDMGVGDDHQPPATGIACQMIGRTVERALFDDDVIAACAQRDGD